MNGECEYCNGLNMLQSVADENGWRVYLPPDCPFALLISGPFLWPGSQEPQQGAVAIHLGRAVDGADALRLIAKGVSMLLYRTSDAVPISIAEAKRLKDTKGGSDVP